MGLTRHHFLPCLNKPSSDDKDEEDKPSPEDSVHEALGEFGLFQLGINLILSLSSIAIAWQILSMNFLAAKTDFWCSGPDDGEEGASLFVDDQDWASFPRPLKEDGSVDQCRVYDLDYSRMDLLEDFKPSNDTPTRACTSFAHNTTEWHLTVIQKFDLVCDRGPWVAYCNSIFMSGVGTGVYLSGLISDHYGRRLTTFGLLLGSVAFGLGSAFADDFNLWITLRWFTYACCFGLYTVKFVQGMEFLSGRHRGMIGTLILMFWVFGILIFPSVVSLLMDSHKIQLVAALTNAPFLLIYLLLPESPRWLIGKGRHEEAKALLTRGATINRREVPKVWTFEDKDEENNDIMSSKPSSDQPLSPPPPNFLSLFRTPRLRTYTLAMYLLWFGQGFVYYGIGLNLGEIGGDLFTSFTLFGVVDVPAFILCSIMLSMRKVVLFPLMLLTASCLLGTMGFNKGEYEGDWPIVTLAMMAKFGLSITFTAIYTYSVEVFPTTIRSAGVSTSACMAVGSILSPLTFSLSSYDAKFFPTGLLGVVYIVCAFSFLFLPETFGKPLLKTIEELEEGRTTGMFSKMAWGFEEKKRDKINADDDTAKYSI